MISNLRIGILAIALLALPAAVASAQDSASEALGTNIESGRSLDGYFVWALFAAGALFAIGKTARR